ncbi:unnamed protein product [Fusarium venenatum]|uniref:Guanylate kinase-like domain-containing protein n=1 Tax=Fusarium venenatum TaxID=56646 RepID=A0A2L2U4X4_9HYPO|nr:uncharacterized protein FVRRES_10422 [Fusarium venenatum]KAH6967026.1 P-loop containing nucleoside triphosphate hydrolase protein [Fusarium venenatum]CEI70345.1 unnamed protein product [Fusarium venenatum]
MASTHPQAAPYHRPIVISGPSGVGKGTLIQKLIDSHPGKFSLGFSHTTRKPRLGEVEGMAYNFVPRSAFLNLLENDSFIEHTYFSGNYCGTSKENIASQQKQGSIVLLDIDIEGIKTITKSQSLHARYVFIKPTNFRTLESRLRARGTEVSRSKALSLA